MKTHVKRKSTAVGGAPAGRAEPDGDVNEVSGCMSEHDLTALGLGHGEAAVVTFAARLFVMPDIGLKGLRAIAGAVIEILEPCGNIRGAKQVVRTLERHRDISQGLLKPSPWAHDERTRQRYTNAYNGVVKAFRRLGSEPVKAPDAAVASETGPATAPAMASGTTVMPKPHTTHAWDRAAPRLAL